MGVYEEIAGNATTLRQFVALFEEACSVIAPGVPALDALCDAVVSGLLESVLPFLDKELSTLAWDIPETFCAVFIPVCTIPCCDAPTAPEQRRLAWTADPAAMSVQWTTLQLVAGAGAQVFPAAGGPPGTFALATPRTYALGGWQGTLYSATMTGLAAGTAYGYRVGSDAGGWSAVAHFTTLPAGAGSDARPLRLVHIGDMGWGNNSNATIAAVTALAAAGEIDGVLHSGDVSYADGQQKAWDVFGRKIESISSIIPYMTGVGNHEQVWWGGAPYRARWTMPPALNASTGAPLPPAVVANRSFYSLSLGQQALLFAMIDTESVLDVSDVSAANVAWLREVLAAPAAAPAWRVVLGHRPLYCTNGGFGSNNKDCNPMAAVLRKQVEDTFKAGGVHLCLTSHMHGFERSLPVFNGVVTPGATVHIVNGAGGNREGNDNPRGNAPWSAPGAHSGAFGFGLMTIAAKTLR
jgi:hypothetical protein